LSELPDASRALIEATRRAVLATVDSRGIPALVPICFALRGAEIVTAVDHKPKGKRELGRVRNIRSNPNVCVLFDRWDEDWRRLGWVQVYGAARIEPPRSADAELSKRYPQYREIPPEGDVIAVAPSRVVWWSFE
ncbi:MAG: TIGR03668 family PPOX class F420-dependent oxidoreductase, partial [Actinomycetota bacterium]